MQELKFTSTSNSQNRSCRVYRIITGTTEEITDRVYDFSQEEFIYENENIIGEYEIRCDVNGELCVYTREVTESMLPTPPPTPTPIVFSFNVVTTDLNGDPCVGGDEFTLYGLNSNFTSNNDLYTNPSLNNLWVETNPLKILVTGDLVYEYDGQSFIGDFGACTTPNPTPSTTPDPTPSTTPDPTPSTTPDPTPSTTPYYTRPNT